MAKIKVNWNETVGPVKKMHGVGQPPFHAMRFNMLRYLTDAGIPYSRLHDVGGLYGGSRYVDIPNVFPDFDADETDPASYDFAFTDVLMAEIVKAGVEPFYRLGVTIENHCAIKMYRLAPPADPLKWAKICEHVIRHYTEGWADGFNYNIQYWEIWNEADNSPDIPENQMWWGTKEQFFELYDVAATYLKEKFPHLSIGGYASCGFYGILQKETSPDASCSPRNQYFLDFFDEFLVYIKEHNSPMDFFSWHSYGSIKDTIRYCDYARKKLDEAGYGDVEHMCNEWNCEPGQRGTMRHAALTAGWMLAMQDTTLDKAMFYDARFGVSIYGGMFNPETAKPYPAYYAFVGWNELYKLGTQVKTCVCSDCELYAVSAVGEGGAYLLISNPSGEDTPLEPELGGKKVTGCRITTAGKVWEECELPKVLPRESFIGIALE